MFKDAENIKGVKDFERRLNIFFNLLVGPSLFAFIILYLELKLSGSRSSVPESNIVYVVVPSTILILVFAELQFRRKLKSIIREMPLKEKLGTYLPVYRMRGSLSAFSILLVLAALFLEKDSIYVLLFFISFAYLSLVRPSQRKLSRHLKFTKKDIEMMESYAEFE